MELMSDRWQPDVQALWEQGRRQDAINRLLERINAAAPAVPRMAGLQFVYYLFQLGDLPAGERVLRELVRAHPGDGELIENLGVFLSRQGKVGDARPLMEEAVRLRPDSANAWDGLANILATLGDLEPAREAGERSLALKTAAAQPLQGWTLPDQRPDEFLAGRQTHPVIAFTLWGRNPRYLRGAVRNLLLIPELYPGWKARFYVDGTVPTEFTALAEQVGAELCRQPDGQSLRERLCWRFQVANDPGVGRFLVRDCDSVVSVRERRAVQAWIDSDRYFHVMRDWWTHTDPVLAGMWGGIAGVLPELAPLLRAYRPPALETPNVDQWFLRDCLWASLRTSALIHDRCFRSEGSQPWPDPDPEGNRHVGQDESRSPWQRTWLQPWLQTCPWLGEPDSTYHRSLQPAGVEQQAIWRRFPAQSSAPETQGNLQPRLLQGLYINLPEARQRRVAMEQQLEALGLSGSHHRFEACTATAAEARERGIRRGDLGLWRSHLGVLRQLLASGAEAHAVLHVLEDDAVLQADLSEQVRRLWQQEPPWDVLFTESFVTAELYQKMLAQLKARPSTDELLVLQGGWYLACTSSYLVSAQGAGRLLELLEREFRKPQLEPIDMAIRRLIRSGALRAGITLPFLTTIQLDPQSFVQEEGRSAAVRRSQNLDLFLRRFLFHGHAKKTMQDDFRALLQSFTDSFTVEEQQELAGLFNQVAHQAGLLPTY
jgi:GR25 family glycosyltransferase involved in LPS biosynthesis